MRKLVANKILYETNMFKETVWIYLPQTDLNLISNKDNKKNYELEKCKIFVILNETYLKNIYYFILLHTIKYNI